MYKIKGLADLINLQNEECSCFGPAQRQDQQFLAKHKTSDITSPSHITHPHPNNDQSHIKNGFKKSLKRIPASTSQVPCFRGREGRGEVPHSQGWEGQDFGSPRSRIGNQPHPVYPSSSEGQHHLQEVIGHEGERRNGPTMFQLRPIYVPESHPVTPFPHSPPAPALKITYSIPPPCFLTPELRRNELSSCKELPTLDKSTTKTPEKDLTVSLHSELQDVDSLQLERQISQDHLLTFHSPPRASHPPLLEPKKSLMALKKIDDVMEIYSQADSSEGSDSDNESIVVGRLNEYCSMLQPKCESSSTVEKSKGVSAVSSSISHYFTRTLQH